MAWKAPISMLLGKDCVRQDYSIAVLFHHVADSMGHPHKLHDLKFDRTSAELNAGWWVRLQVCYKKNLPSETVPWSTMLVLTDPIHVDRIKYS